MNFICETTSGNLIDMRSAELRSLLPKEEGHDPMDGGGRATQEAKAEDEGGVKLRLISY